MLGSETIPDNAFVSVHPVLGVSLLVSTRLLAPLASTDFADPFDGVVALAPRSLGPRIHGGRLLRRDYNPDVGSSRCGQRFIHRSRIVGSVCSEPRDSAFNLLEYRDANRRIGHNSVCESRRDDVAVPVNGQMQLARAAASARGPVLVSLPLVVAKYFSNRSSL